MIDMYFEDSHYPRVSINQTMHPYNAYTGIVHKPRLSVVLTVCNNFLQPFYGQNGGDLIWDPNETMWVSL